jgi:hypothetical protein
MDLWEDIAGHGGRSQESHVVTEWQDRGRDRYKNNTGYMVRIEVEYDKALFIQVEGPG